ncbi:Hypothetical protein D9617_5g069390 [Elsinoe fawcettii]|nr:Hypothetical protein D9617_5g069390 [Elsinoe fawcettii]
MPHATSLPTPNNPKGDGITYYASSIIEASPADIFSVLKDYQNYDKWNTMNQKADFPKTTAASRELQVGDEGTLNSHLASPTAKLDLTHVTITKIVQGDNGQWLMSWKCTDFNKHLLRPERVLEIVDLGNGSCEFKNYETMAGPMRISVQAFVGSTLDAGLQRMADDLKKFVEAKV